MLALRCRGDGGAGSSAGPPNLATAKVGKTTPRSTDRVSDSQDAQEHTLNSRIKKDDVRSPLKADTIDTKLILKSRPSSVVVDYFEHLQR